jgi:hypothetical protein
MTDRVDPIGNRMQATLRQPMIDGVFPNPTLQKLPSRKHSVLSPRQLSDERVGPRSSSPQPVYIAG